MPSEFESPEYEPTSIMDFRMWECTKKHCRDLVIDECINIQMQMQSLDAKAKRKRNGVHTTAECMATFKQQLDVLLKRLHKTTTEVEGKDEFRDDIDQIESDMKMVLQHGWQHIKDLRHFPRFDEPRVLASTPNSRARRTRRQM